MLRSMGVHPRLVAAKAEEGVAAAEVAEEPQLREVVLRPLEEGAVVLELHLREVVVVVVVAAVAAEAEAAVAVAEGAAVAEAAVAAVAEAVAGVAEGAAVAEAAAGEA
jgi:hypothetical protein